MASNVTSPYNMIVQKITSLQSDKVVMRNLVVPEEN